MTGQPISESLLAAAVHSADAAGEGDEEDEEEAAAQQAGSMISSLPLTY